MTENTREVVRNQLLLDALSGPIDLNAVDWRVKHQHSSASALEVQNGPFRAGAPGGKAKRFVAWRHSLDHSLRKISRAYIKRYDDPEKWMYSAWLALTAKGELLARSIEAEDIDGYRPEAP